MHSLLCIFSSTPNRIQRIRMNTCTKAWWTFVLTGKLGKDAFQTQSSMKRGFLDMCSTFVPMVSPDNIEDHVRCDENGIPSQAMLHIGTSSQVVEAVYGLVFKCTLYHDDLYMLGSILRELYASKLLSDAPGRNVRFMMPQSLTATDSHLLISMPHAGVPLWRYLEYLMLESTKTRQDMLHLIFSIWIQLLECVSELHVYLEAAHLALDPSHVMVNPITTRVSLVGFGQCQRHIPQFGNFKPDAEEGPSGYPSPSKVSAFSPPEAFHNVDTLQNIKRLKTYDVWSLAVIFHYMAHAFMYGGPEYDYTKVLFSGPSSDSILHHIQTRWLCPETSHRVQVWETNRRFLDMLYPHRDWKKTKAQLELLKSMMHPQPAERPPISRILLTFQ